MITRPLGRPYSASNVIPVPTPDNAHPVQAPIARGGFPGLHLPYGNRPMMRVGHGGVIPAAQDPTDSSTWRVPVVFT